MIDSKLYKLAKRLALTTKVHSVHFRLRRLYYKRRFRLSDTEFRYFIGDSLNIGLDDFTYRDQSWAYVRHLNDIQFAKSVGMHYLPLDNACTNTKISNITRNSAKIDGGKQSDNWLYWDLSTVLPENYTMRFDVTINSFLTEFQIAFLHTAIYDRLRFQVVDNEVLSFDVVRDGFFFNKLFEKPFEFKQGDRYLIELVLLRNRFCFKVNDKIILAVEDQKFSNEMGGLAIILWDKHGADSMNVMIDNFEIREIHESIQGRNPR